MGRRKEGGCEGRKGALTGDWPRRGGHGDDHRDRMGGCSQPQAASELIRKEPERGRLRAEGTGVAEGAEEGYEIRDRGGGRGMTTRS
ncbi:hypothetical protein SLA2020_266970 [Shorea laevis]